jgi:hypothetical protein
MNWRNGIATLVVAAVMGCSANKAQDCGAAPCDASDKGKITIYPGEQRSVAFSAQGDKLTPVPAGAAGDPAANSVDLALSKTDNGMVLTVTNPMSRDLKYDVMMRAPDDQLVYTSSCPVGPGLMNFEHWPHDIKYLELSNFRLLKEGDDTACE